MQHLHRTRHRSHRSPTIGTWITKGDQHAGTHPRMVSRSPVGGTGRDTRTAGQARITPGTVPAFSGVTHPCGGTGRARPGRARQVCGQSQALSPRQAASGVLRHLRSGWVQAEFRRLAVGLRVVMGQNSMDVSHGHKAAFTCTRKTCPHG